MRPVLDKFPISQHFGVPGDYAAGVHTGTDFAVPVGTPVHAPRRGVVIESRYDPNAYGHYIHIRGWFRRNSWLFAHLSKRKVVVGQRVKQGQVIGLSGNTGNSTGPHLHAEQRRPPFGYRNFIRPKAWKG